MPTRWHGQPGPGVAKMPVSRIILRIIIVAERMLWGHLFPEAQHVLCETDGGRFWRLQEQQDLYEGSQVACARCMQVIDNRCHIG